MNLNQPQSYEPALPGLSVIVPCYNEVTGLPRTLAEIETALESLATGQNLEWEIIVVDDGSIDKIDGSIGHHAKLRVKRHPQNLGYGAALKSGARLARYDLLAILDADGTYPADKLSDLYAALENNAMAVGARTGADVHIPTLRKPAKWVLTRLANYLTGTRIPDLNSGFRIIRRYLWQRYEPFFPDGFSLTTTITLAALTNGHSVAYVPINYHRRLGTSKIRPAHDTIEFMRLILRTILYFDPIKVFLPLSLILLAASLIIGFGSLILAHVFHRGQFLDVTTVLLFIAAVQTLAIGALADLITKRLS